MSASARLNNLVVRLFAKTSVSLKDGCSDERRTA
jgi:hypothetical protein